MTWTTMGREHDDTFIAAALRTFTHDEKGDSCRLDPGFYIGADKVPSITHEKHVYIFLKGLYKLLEGDDEYELIQRFIKELMDGLY